MRPGKPMLYHALLLTGVSLLIRLAGTGFQFYLSRRIGTAGIGLLQLVLSVGALSMTAGLAGIRTAAMYLTAEAIGKKHSLPPILSACCSYSLLCSITVGALLFAAAPRIAANWIGSIQTIPSIRLYALFLPVSCLVGVLNGYCTASGRIRILSSVEIAETCIAMTVSVLALTFWAEHDSGKICFSVVLGSCIGSLCSLVLLTAYCGAMSSASSRFKKQKLYAIAVPLALADDLKAGISTAENLMVPRRLSRFSGSLSPLSQFGMVCGMVFPMMMFPAAFLFGLTELLIPEIARCHACGSFGRIRYLARRSLHIALLYGLICAGLLGLLAQPLCLFFLHTGEPAAYLRLFSFLVPMLYCDMMTDSMVKGLGQQKVCVQYNILTSSLDLLFLYLLLPHYGMNGYFFSFLATHLLNFCLSLHLLIRLIGPPVSAAATLKALGSTAAAVWLAHFCPHPSLRFFVFLLSLGSLLALLQVVSRADLRWILGMMKKTDLPS